MNDCNQSCLNCNVKNKVIESLKLLKRDVSDLYLPKEIAVLNEIPSPFEFYRNWVAKNIPVLIKGGAKHWPAVSKWNKSYFCEKFKDKKISVAVTPDGYADAITETTLNGKAMEIFVLPEERLMTVNDFFNKLDAETSGYSDQNVRESKGIFYIQKQNSNLVEEFPELLQDIDEHLFWASETFQSKPTAINLWIGDERAISSLHKDPFENIYCVISGCKDFILLPPSDRPWLPYKNVPVGQYKERSPGDFEVNMFYSNKWRTKSSNEEDEDNSSIMNDSEDNQIQWIAIDPTCPDYNKYPLYKYASPIKVRVEKGDMFYLPSLWFHHVTQSHKCIAVNYWYDISMDIKYVYFQFLHNLANLCEIGS